MSEQEAQVPDQVEGEPVVEVQEATDPLTAGEVREALARPPGRERDGPGRLCRPGPLLPGR